MWITVGTIAAFLTMLAFFPQIVKVKKSRSAKDVSLVMLIQLSLGVSLWIAYGLYRKDAIIILANSVTLLSLLILIVLYFRYKKRAEL